MGIVLMSGDTKPLYVSIIIPTVKKEVSTLKAIGKSLNKDNVKIETIIVKNIRPAGKARNIGAQIARGNALVFVDDDILFRHEDFIGVLREIQRLNKALIGGEGIEPFMGIRFIGTRFLAIQKDDFMELGGFNEVLYGFEDIEFSLRAGIKGFELFGYRISLEHVHPRGTMKLLMRNLLYERSGTLVAMKYAKILRLKVLHWFFPLFIYPKIYPITLFRNGITRSIVRVFSFYYWALKSMFTCARGKNPLIC